MTGAARPPRLSSYGCLTPFGDARATHAALLRGETSLRPVPVLGVGGDDRVPLALLGARSLDDESPPIWLEALRGLGRMIPGEGWGGPRRPVFVTGSNFGVGGLYALRRHGDASFAAWGAPPACTEQVRLMLGYGPDVSALSLACVSAHLGLLEAARVVASGCAERALVLSFDFLSPFVAGGFHALKILNTDYPTPFRERPSGSIGLGDGAAFAVVSAEDGDWLLEAQTLHNEMHHFTSNRPDGSGFERCMEAMAAAARGTRVWVKGHGTGTLEAGRMEVAAAARAFPGAPITGWKGGLGHTLGSCGLVELAVALESARTGVAPAVHRGAGAPMAGSVATENFPTGDYDGVVLASNAFGGAHAAVLLRHA